MQYGDAVVVLEGMIKSLESHIELAQKGLIQEDCIGCRQKDLEAYKGILEVLQKEHEDKNGWHRIAMEWPLKIDKSNKALEIVKNKRVNVDYLYRCIKLSNNPLGAYNNSIFRGSKLEPSEYEILNEVLELCPDSKIAK